MVEGERRGGKDGGDRGVVAGALLTVDEVVNGMVEVLVVVEVIPEVESWYQVVVAAGTLE